MYENPLFKTKVKIIPRNWKELLWYHRSDNRERYELANSGEFFYIHGHQTGSCGSWFILRKLTGEIIQSQFREEDVKIQSLKEKLDKILK